MLLLLICCIFFHICQFDSFHSFVSLLLLTENLNFWAELNDQLTGWLLTLASDFFPPLVALVSECHCFALDVTACLSLFFFLYFSLLLPKSSSRLKCHYTTGVLKKKKKKKIKINKFRALWENNNKTNTSINL